MIWEIYIREELAEWERTGCPRVFGELRESFRRYFHAQQAPDWSAA